MIEVSAGMILYMGTRLGELAGALRPGATWDAFLSEATAAVDLARLYLRADFVPKGLERSKEQADQFIAELTRSKREIGLAPLTQQQYLQVHRALTDFLQELTGDFDGLRLLHVPQRLAYDSATLLDDPGKLFGELQPEIMRVADRDICESATAYAFNLGTAASFHILRACERVMVVYCRACGLTIPDDGGSWATYIRALGTVPDLPPRMRGRLDRLKDYDRNEIMHPGRFVEPEEADDLVDYIKSSMKDMMRDIKKRLQGLYV